MRKFNFGMNQLDELAFALEHPRVRNWTLARVRQEGEITFIEYNRWTGQYRYWGSEGAYHSPWMAQIEIRQKLDWEGWK